MSDDYVRARNTDPSTSHEAADKVGGFAHAHYYQILQALLDHGPLGKDGIAKVLGFPFSFIPLGGISDSSYLKGHLYTYEGSTYGKIVDEIIKAKVMNPIFFSMNWIKYHQVDMVRR